SAPNATLSQKLTRARALTLSGALDDAATLLDAAIDQAARAPESILQPTPFVDALVQRAGIALARGEITRARTLLARLYRYDPSCVLQHEEQTPQLEAAASDVHQQLGAIPPLESGDLGPICAAHEVLLVPRRLLSGAVEIQRFDRCRPVMEALI